MPGALPGTRSYPLQQVVFFVLLRDFRVWFDFVRSMLTSVCEIPPRDEWAMRVPRQIRTQAFEECG